MPTITLSPTASNHDAIEASGTMTLDGTALILSAGTRDAGLWVDATAYVDDLPGNVTAATLHYYPTNTSYDDPLLVWYGFDEDSTAVFTTTASDISSRALTTASASDSGTGVGTGQRSIDITTIIQEITDRAGWTGPIGLRGDCTGGINLRFYAYDNGSSIWDIEITYTEPDPEGAVYAGSITGTVSSGSTSLGVDLGTRSVGDLALVLISRNQDDEAGTVPTGWTLLQSHINASASHFLYYKVLEAGDLTEVFWTSYPVTGKGLISAHIYTNVDPDDPIESSTKGAYLTSSAKTLDFGSTTTDQLTIALFAGVNTIPSSFDISSLTDYTERYDYGSITPDFWQLAADTDHSWGGGTSAPSTSTDYLAENGTYRGAFMVAIRELTEGPVEQAVSGALGSAGALARRPSVLRAGVLTSSGAAVRRIGKGVVGTLTSAGVAVRRTSRGLAGSLTSSGAAVRQTARGLAGAVSPTGGLTAARAFARALAGTLTSGGAAVRQTARGLAGAVSPAGAVTKVKAFLRSVGGTLTSSGAVTTTRALVRALSGAVSSSGVVAKQTGRALVGSVASAGAAVRQTGKAAAGSLESSGLVGTARVTLLALAGALGAAGALVRQTVTARAGSVEPSGVVTKQAARALAGLVDAVGGVGRQTLKQAAGVLATAGAAVASYVPVSFVPALVQLTARARAFGLTAARRLFNLHVR
jgi:hypothetical protein